MTARGLQIDLSFTGAPAWAEGAQRPKSAPPGSWKPRPEALREYGKALAKRYSGSFPDPANPGRSLPPVRHFQVWNEPNLSKYLSPQWTRRSRNRFSPYSPGHYRAMLNAFYDGVKSVRPDAVVLTAGTAPFGDPQPGGRRIMPVRFWRIVLARRTRFDVLAHHPYGVTTPTRHGLNHDDVTAADMGKLRRLLRSRGYRQPLWVTEFSFDSSPPDPDGVPAAQHARWLAEGFYVMWKAGVRTILWFQIRDQPPAPSYGATNQSGTYLINGRPKPAATAFRFPFVVVPGRRGLTAWGRAPEAGTLLIQRRNGNRWVTERRTRVGARSTFLLRLSGSPATVFRARVAGRTSLPFAGAQYGRSLVPG